jgi:hypothetical protein
MSNLPADWNSYKNCCELCGQKYHESEGFCECFEHLKPCSCERNSWVRTEMGIICYSCGEEGELDE